MTQTKEDKINDALNRVYDQMIQSGNHNRDDLNKRFLIYNLASFTTDSKEVFQTIINDLTRLNENTEDYDICIQLQKINKILNRTRKKKNG